MLLLELSLDESVEPPELDELLSDVLLLLSDGFSVPEPLSPEFCEESGVSEPELLSELSVLLELLSELLLLLPSELLLLELFSLSVEDEVSSSSSSLVGV